MKRGSKVEKLSSRMLADCSGKAEPTWAVVPRNVRGSLGPSHNRQKLWLKPWRRIVDRRVFFCSFGHFFPRIGSKALSKATLPRCVIQIGSLRRMLASGSPRWSGLYTGRRWPRWWSRDPQFYGAAPMRQSQEGRAPLACNEVPVIPASSRL